MILPILQDGDPILRQPAARVEAFTVGVVELAHDLLDTLLAANGYGLAAPQIGVSRRLIVVNVNRDRLIMVNPLITERSGEQRSLEGCLSVNNGKRRETVLRAAKIRVVYQDVFGEVRKLKAKALLAACIQHEINHLDGILFTDLVTK